ncbi:efflux RND transporter periplasmic adaptor subunit [Shewanella sp. 202IG2-18]|uniref:efflux RND transporter periplasmic adaptor subunit n=1 Tax=Parashewanella hymeniacidonis TaxID=2807618 RepID=UPI001961ABA7|nr:efflux RND transporter periplasmic adaptor subunit [Parashewanella hymeniacidonis]MBM7074069.1 efflux RND transporter periplasmic adaptor subunit [Parashewanella hymeniacidonis]
MMLNNQIYKNSTIALTILLTLGWGSVCYAGDDHSHDVQEEQQQAHKGEERHSEVIKLTQEQMQLAGIKLTSIQSSILSLDNLDVQHVATATLAVNRNLTAAIDPQLDVLVLKRHIVPGQEVKKGQVLLELGGKDVAQAQAEYINAAREWDRVKRLGKNAVSDSQRQQTLIDAKLKKAILRSINMTESQITALKRSPELVGSFELLSPLKGRVQQDISRVGQINPAGTPLMQLTDETSLWVEAELTPQQAKDLTAKRKAVVKIGNTLIEAKLIGRSHELDNETRTEEVLFSISNSSHKLHAGEFVELFFSAGDKVEQGIVVPDSALTRSADGDWQLFFKDSDGFESIEVNVVERQGGLNRVVSPELKHLMSENVDVVLEGAFFLASEKAKSGFDIHNH